MTQPELLDLLLEVARCADQMDRDVYQRFGVPGHFSTVRMLPSDLVQKCPGSERLTLGLILETLRPTSTSLERDARPEERGS